MDPNNQFSPRLVVIEGHDKGKVISLKSGSAVIGRSKSDILISDPRISRVHISLHFDEKMGRLFFKDLKSLNHTLINGEPQNSGELHDGDKIKIGDTIFDCQILPPEQTATSSNLLQRLRNLTKKNPSLIPMDKIELSKEQHQDADRKTNENKSYGGHHLKDRWSQVSLTKRLLILLILLTGGYLLLRIQDPRLGSLKSEMHQIQELEKEGRSLEALSRTKELARQYPNRAELHGLLGDLFYSQENLESAIEAYLKAKQLDPNQTHALVRLVQIYNYTGLEDQAKRELSALESILKFQPKSEVLYSEVGELYLELQAFDKALEIAQALQLEVAADKPIGHKLEAQAWIGQNKPKEALNALERAQKFLPLDEWIAENLTVARIQLKDYTAALTQVDEWLKINPENARALLLKAYLFYNGQKYQEALLPLERVLKLTNSRSKEHLEALNLMGQTYFYLNDMEGAANRLEVACQSGYQQSCDLLRALNRENTSSGKK